MTSSTFAIEIYWPGVTEVSARDLAARARSTAVAMAGEGTDVRFVGCTLSPSDEVCFISVESDGQATIAQLARRLGLDDPRISAMVDLTADDREQAKIGSPPATRAPSGFADCGG